MKNTLFLLALGMVSASTLAQTNLTLYGLVDAGFVRESGGPSGPVTKLTSGIENGSRLGFRGTEDLGGGLSAIFTLENGFATDTGAQLQGALFGRQAFVGLNGGFGAVTLGRQYTPIDNLVGATDPFYNGRAGRIQNVFMQGYVIAAPTTT